MLKIFATTALSLFSLGTCQGNAPAQEQTPPAETCYEDESCWNCLSMGNRQCGQYPGLRVEVDPGGHISVYQGTDLIGWGSMEGAVQD